MAGLHICFVNRLGADDRGEYVEIANDGATAIRLTGLKLTDYTGTQARPHIYQFPALSNGAPLVLKPRQLAFCSLAAATATSARRATGCFSRAGTRRSGTTPATSPTCA